MYAIRILCPEVSAKKKVYYPGLWKNRRLAMCFLVLNLPATCKIVKAHEHRGRIVEDR